MLIPRGGLKSPPPSLLQRLGPVAASMRQVSPVRTMTVSRDATEPLEEGEERSPGRKTRKPRGGRGRKRGDRDREKGNWDSFVPAEEDRDEYLSGDDGMGGRRMFEPRRDRSQSRSPRAHTGSVSPKSKSRSSSPLQNPATTPTRSSSREKHTRHPDARLSPRSPSRSRSRSQSRSPIRTQDQSPRSHGRSRSRSGSRSSFSRRSRSRSPPPQFRRERERESWAERDRKNITPAPNPGASSATANAVGPGPAIPTGPRWRAGPNAQAPSAPSVARAAPGVVRGGPPPTGPRGDREPPRGPRNMIASGITTGGAVGIPAGPGAGPATWDRPQSAFQSYLAAVQSKIVEREVKKKEEEEEHAPGDGPAGNTQPESIAMDVDIKEEQNPGPGVEAFHSYTPPVAEPSRESSQVASPAHFNLPQISSLHASPASGQTIPLPPQSGPSLPGTHTPTFSHLGAHVSLPLPQVHPLPLPPRPRSPPRAPRSPPRGPRATRGLPEKPKGMGGGEPSRDGAERDRGRDSAERGRDRNERGERDRVGGGEVERKVHALPTNPARRPRMPTVRTSKREVLFPDLEKEIANLEDQRARLASEHVPYAIAFQQAVHDLTLSTIDYRAAEDRRVMTEAVLEAMGKVSGLTAGSDM